MLSAAGVGVAAMAVAAYIAHSRATAYTAAAPVSTSVSPVANAPAASSVPAASAVAAAPSPSAVAAAGTDPAALPLAKNETSPAPGPGGGGRKSYVNPTKASTPLGGSGSTVSGLSAMMAQAATPASDPPPPPSAAPGALGAAVQQAVGGAGAAPQEHSAAPSGPQFAPGSVVEKPSQGAVTSALGAVIPQARNCLNPDDPVSRANVTFTSPGTVSRVVVTGSAAGKPAEQCIKNALMKATVPPFAQENYAATITIRPN
jgi:hypothetical protein